MITLLLIFYTLIGFCIYAFGNANEEDWHLISTWGFILIFWVLFFTLIPLFLCISDLLLKLRN